MADYDVHQDRDAILQRFEALRIKTRSEIFGVACELDEARFAGKPVHRVDVISTRMAVLEQHLVEVPPRFEAVIDSYVKKGRQFTQRRDYPAAEIESRALDLNAGTTIHKVYSFLCLFTLSELYAIGI
ncbi:MAG: hypothetical protein AB8H86_31120 [Polyangiales bacterium]